MEVSGNLWESVFLSEQYSKWDRLKVLTGIPRWWKWPRDPLNFITSKPLI